MSKKRKDSHGQILKKGESQRANGTYSYRYTNIQGKRKSIYAKTLEELRNKEKDIVSFEQQGIVYQSTIKIIDLMEELYSIKPSNKYNTLNNYKVNIKLIKNFEFPYRQIQKVKKLDAQKFLIDVKESGRSYSTIESIKAMMHYTFQNAIDNDLIIKNPFDFPLSGIIRYSRSSNVHLTKRQQNALLTFLKNDEVYSKYYDDVILLLGTGLRVSEFLGLTLNDLDFENKLITIDHQLICETNKKLHISEPKTRSSNRVIPMIPEVEESLYNLIKRRNETISLVNSEPTIDGYTNFLILNSNGTVRKSSDMRAIIGRIYKKYKLTNPTDDMPRFSSHSFRHTFCTNLFDQNIDLKTIQLLMGHNTFKTTFDTYTHFRKDINIDNLKVSFSLN